jgi:hypothetical protein
MAAADFDAPALPFGVPEGFLDLFLRMRGEPSVASSIIRLSSGNLISAGLTRISRGSAIRKFKFPGFRSL